VEADAIYQQQIEVTNKFDHYQLTIPTQNTQHHNLNLDVKGIYINSKSLRTTTTPNQPAFDFSPAHQMATYPQRAQT